MKHIPTWIKITFVLALLIASKFLFFSSSTSKLQGGPKGGNTQPVKVNYFVVRQSNIENSLFASGTLGAFNQIELVSEVAGRIVGIYFREGEMVRKGDLLVKLNDADLQAQLQKIQTQISLASQKLERLKKLLAINGVSQEEFDIQQGELSSLKADEAYTKAQLAKTAIAAPFEGVIGLKDISEGSFVNALTPLASLVQLKPIYVEFAIPEKYQGLFKKGGTISFTNETTGSAKSYTASIYAIEPRVDEATKTIRARALYNGTQTFLPGGFVKVFVDLDATENAMMVPTEAIIATLKGQKVFVSRNGIAEEAQVQIGVRTDDKIQIMDGLKVGDTVLTSGLMSVKKDSKLILMSPKK